jgi:SAM-dependent methyltransferase
MITKRLIAYGRKVVSRSLRMMTGKQSGELFPGFEITSADTLVDVGCGPGQPCVFAGNLGADVIAVDIDPGVIDQIKQTMHNVPARSFRAYVSDSNPLPLPDGIASIVVAQEVMEHVDDPARFLAELVRIGRPGARYLISVPDPASEFLMRAVAPGWYFQKPGHIHVFERAELDRLVGAAGLKIETRIPFGFYWSMWWVLRWTTGLHYPPGSAEPPPPVLAHWDRTWQALLSTREGRQAVHALDEAVPKSQVLVARKAA